MREKRDVQSMMDCLHQELPRLKHDFAVHSLGLFGSYVRGEQGEGSDLDVLVEFSRTPGMLTFLQLESELSKVLGVSVDLVERKALKPAIGRRIFGEVLEV